MATPVPPALQLGRPPVTPPDVPTLSSVRVGEGAAPGPGVAGALPRLFFELNQQISTLAQILPEQSAKLDSIRSQLQEVLAIAVQQPGLAGRDENRTMIGSASDQSPAPMMG